MIKQSGAESRERVKYDLWISLKWKGQWFTVENLRMMLDSVVGTVLLRRCALDDGRWTMCRWIAEINSYFWLQSTRLNPGMKKCFEEEYTLWLNSCTQSKDDDNTSLQPGEGERKDNHCLNRVLFTVPDKIDRFLGSPVDTFDLFSPRIERDRETTLCFQFIRQHANNNKNKTKQEEDVACSQFQPFWIRRWLISTTLFLGYRCRCGLLKLLKEFRWTTSWFLFGVLLIRLEEETVRPFREKTSFFSRFCFSSRIDIDRWWIGFGESIETHEEILHELLDVLMLLVFLDVFLFVDLRQTHFTFLVFGSDLFLVRWCSFLC